MKILSLITIKLQIRRSFRLELIAWKRISLLCLSLASHPKRSQPSQSKWTMCNRSTSSRETKSYLKLINQNSMIKKIKRRLMIGTSRCPPRRSPSIVKSLKNSLSRDKFRASRLLILSNNWVQMKWSTKTSIVSNQDSEFKTKSILW